MVDVATRLQAPSRAAAGIHPNVGDTSDGVGGPLLRVAAGHEGAFRGLVAAYGPAVLGLCWRIIGDRSLAEEATQETFLQVWRMAGGYDPARASIRTWIMTIAHRRAVDVVRREQTQRRKTVSADRLEEPDIADEVIAKDWAGEQRQAIRSAIETLPPEQRRVLTLMYFGGMSQSAIADHLNVPLGTVKSRARAGMQHLRSLLFASCDQQSTDPPSLHTPRPLAPIARASA